jgi:hypothetical protein
MSGIHRSGLFGFTLCLLVTTFGAFAQDGKRKEVGAAVFDAIEEHGKPGVVPTPAPSPILEHQLWIGVGFALLLTVFFMVAFFKAKDLSRGQWQILRFFGALCAGAAGGFLTGGALFKASGNLGAMDYSISGVAGFALLFTVWFTWSKFEASAPPVERFFYEIPEGATFEHTANAIVEAKNAFVEFVGFSKRELAASLRTRKLETDSVQVALEQLGRLTAPGAIRSYEVLADPPSYSLRIRS